MNPSSACTVLERTILLSKSALMALLKSQRHKGERGHILLLSSHLLVRVHTLYPLWGGHVYPPGGAQSGHDFVIFKIYCDIHTTKAPCIHLFQVSVTLLLQWYCTTVVGVTSPGSSIQTSRILGTVCFMRTVVVMLKRQADNIAHYISGFCCGQPQTPHDQVNHEVK